MPDLRRVLSLLWRGVAYELSLYRSLLRWVLRRPSRGGPDDEAVGYAAAVTPVLWLWIFGSAVEIPVAHVLLPWPTARGVVLVLGLWGLVWMIGLLASLRAYPHLMDAERLRIRHGARIDVVVPWDAVAEVHTQRRDLPSSIRTLQPVETDSGVELRVGVGGETNVHLALRRPVTVTTPGGSQDVVAVSFLVDDPKAFAARVRRHRPQDGRTRRSA